MGRPLTPVACIDASLLFEFWLPGMFQPIPPSYALANPRPTNHPIELFGVCS